MVQAVGAVSSAPPVQPAATAAALEAQLDLCRRKLSDQVNCASAHTPEGKKSIEELSSRIGLLKERLDKIGNSPSEQTIQARPAAALEGPVKTRTLGSSGGLIDDFA